MENREKWMELCDQAQDTENLMQLTDISGRHDPDSIKNELLRLFNEQAEFFKKGARAKQMPSEVAAYEKRRERLRGLFAELD
jgi:hypothetical protein